MVQISDINTEKTTRTNAATGAINTTKSDYVTQVNDKKTELSNKMAAQFDGISTYANGLINKAGAEALNYATSDLTKATKATGDYCSSISP